MTLRTIFRYRLYLSWGALIIFVRDKKIHRAVKDILLGCSSVFLLFFSQPIYAQSLRPVSFRPINYNSAHIELGFEPYLRMFIQAPFDNLDRNVLLHNLHKHGVESIKESELTEAVNYMHGGISPKNVQIQNIVDQMLNELHRARAPQYERVVAMPGSLATDPIVKVSLRPIPNSLPAFNWKNYVYPRVGTLKNVLSMAKPQIDFLAMRTFQYLALAFADGFTEVYKLNLTNAAYCRSMYLIYNPQTFQRRLIFSDFDGNLYLENTILQIQYLLKDIGLNLRIRRLETPEYFTSDHHRINQLGDQLKEALSKFSNVRLSVGYVPWMAPALETNGFKKITHLTFKEFYIDVFEKDSIHIALVGSKRAYYGDIMPRFLKPSLEAKHVQKVLFMGSAGALSDDLAPYAIFRAQLFRDHKNRLIFENNSPFFDRENIINTSHLRGRRLDLGLTWVFGFGVQFFLFF